MKQTMTPPKKSVSKKQKWFTNAGITHAKRSSMDRSSVRAPLKRLDLPLKVPLVRLIDVIENFNEGGFPFSLKASK